VLGAEGRMLPLMAGPELEIVGRKRWTGPWVLNIVLFVDWCIFAETLKGPQKTSGGELLRPETWAWLEPSSSYRNALVVMLGPVYYMDPFLLPTSPYPFPTPFTAVLLLPSSRSISCNSQHGNVFWVSGAVGCLIGWSGLPASAWAHSWDVREHPGPLGSLLRASASAGVTNSIHV
jgi:hypothetical protein